MRGSLEGPGGMSEIFDATPCELGEGPLWHPVRQQLYWFDIMNCRLHTKEASKTRTFQFDEHVSAAGWVDDQRLLIASESKLFLFDLEGERREDVEGLEYDNKLNRSNDGRADPWGGFWIGTMAKQNANQGQGAIYRYYQGQLKRLFKDISITNAISFAPDGSCAYYADTEAQKVMRQALDPDTGWPDGRAELWLDLEPEGVYPDGAVVDAEGNFWNAQWGAWRVACYAPDATFLKAVNFDAAHTSCPAFGGPEMTTLFCTSARQELSATNKAKSDKHGMVLAAHDVALGQAEHQVIL